MKYRITATVLGGSALYAISSILDYTRTELRCKMETLFVVVTFLTALVSHSTAQFPCKLTSSTAHELLSSNHSLRQINAMSISLPMSVCC